MSNKTVHVPTIGILGGGQLARMTAYAAFRFGLRVAIFERSEPFPCQDITPLTFIGDWKDTELLKNFASVADIITLENEFVDASVLSYLESLGKPVFPGPNTIGAVQDKLIQKRVLSEKNLPVPEFRAIESVEDAKAFGNHFGYPFLLKCRRNGYDGYGNRTVSELKNIESALEELGFPERKIMAEAFVDFEIELATMVVRSAKGEIKVYPIVETIQENHICKIVKAPASIDEQTMIAASALACEAIETIDGVGIFGVEMFLASTGAVLINELAPRPHNSGHYTIEACITSQFENHIRAIFGWRLGNTEMITPAAVMVNLLGKRNGPASLEKLDYSLSDEHVKLHIYGKAETRVGRKMGHVTVLNSSIDKCLNAALSIERNFEL
ncbi:MAG: 5-(carboxyamino)imidazole ribonucleotide synthase [Chlorobiales bacterium]|nr:5-(carboxyamino)imidazole ribonucleotide synthase [Chlorobiales bacterium]